MAGKQPPIRKATAEGWLAGYFQRASDLAQCETVEERGIQRPFSDSLRSKSCCKSNGELHKNTRIMNFSAIPRHEPQYALPTNTKSNASQLTPQTLNRARIRDIKMHMSKATTMPSFRPTALALVSPPTRLTDGVMTETTSSPASTRSVMSLKSKFQSKEPSI